MNLANNSDSDLGNFLSRPIRLGEFSWAVDSPLFEQFNPWFDFLNSPRIREKTANFELYRSKLHVKFVISGTGFHYGRSLVSYNPYFGLDDVTVERNFLSIDLIQASQKPHIFLNPTDNEGGQLDLPFFFPENYLSLSQNDANNMGEISIKSFGPLQHANGGTDPVTVTVYAWASDVVLTMPTSQTTPAIVYSPQSGAMNSGDEYGKGIISKPASAVAHAAGQLKQVPMIAPYARATEMIATGVGALATHWGYSRPPIVTDILLQKPTPLGNLTNTDAADAVQKLSLDSKQEVTIDSRTVGLDGSDQMDIANFVQRESYLTQFPMTATDIPDKLLWNCRVGPMLTAQLGEEIHTTPMAFMATPFKNWQGSITYRFQVVKSNFHKGRILLRYDPRAHNAGVEYNTVYSRVIDLAEESDFEITIGWGQATPFLKVPSLATTPSNVYSNDSRLTVDNSNFWNGILEVNVVNSLVSPALDSSISLNVFVSACEDFKLGSPQPDTIQQFTLFPTPAVTNLTQRNVLETIYEPQSGEADAAATGAQLDSGDAPVGADQVDTIASIAPVSDQTFNVFLGETPKSIRDLMRRYVLHRQLWIDPAFTGTMRDVSVREKGLGYFPGWDPNGIDTHSGDKCSITTPHYLHWFMCCYAGWKGASRTKYTFSGNLDKQPTVSRIGFDTLPYKLEDSVPITDASHLTKYSSTNTGQFTIGGSASTNLGVNDTIEVETPYYQAKRFTTARLPSADFANGAQSNLINFIVGDVPTASQHPLNDYAVLRSWKSVGEDFTFFFFTGCPIVYNNKVNIPINP